MGGSTLNIESCNSSECKIRIDFGLGDRLGLLFSSQSSLQYNVYVTNKDNELLKTFSITSRFERSKVLKIPLEGIEGEPEDLFDIQVNVFRLKPNSDPIHFTRVNLPHCEMILQNRFTTQDEASPKPKSKKESRRSVLKVTDCDANYVRIHFKLDLITYLGTLSKRKKLYHKIEVKNLTRNKREGFLISTNQGRNTSFNVPLDNVPGCSTDDFDILVIVYDNRNEVNPITSASLEIWKKLLLFRKSDEENARQQEEENRLKRQRAFPDAIRRDEEQQRLKKQREEQKKQFERIKLQEEAERQRVEDERRARNARRVQIQREYEAKQLQKQLEKQKYDQIPYSADVSVESTNPRKVSICVQFNKDTYEKLIFESKEIGNRIQFELIATNQNAFGTSTSQVYQGNVALTQHLPFERSLKLGNKYTFHIDVKKYSPDYEGFVTFLSKIVEHKEVLLKSELRTLMRMGKQFQQIGFHRQHLPVKYAYRNKPRQYFANIKRNRSNIMEVYLKDNTGDPGCPINGEINGLFFAISVDPDTNEIPEVSPFGSHRIIIPIEVLVNICSKFYFADFYCITKKHHYVTLVATRPHSQADKFCRDHLLKISLDNNPFFNREQQWNYRTGDLEYEYHCCREPRVEILFTENIDLNSHYIEWDQVRIIGSGTSTPGGKPKLVCGSCNLKQNIYHTNSF